MPKETTYAEANMVEGHGNVTFKSADVSWHRDAGIVDVGITARQLDGPAIGETDPEHSAYASFSRHAVNKLIRDLRRARDQAFGRDE